MSIGSSKPENLKHKFLDITWFANLSHKTPKRELANNADPDQMPQNVASDLLWHLIRVYTALKTEISIKHSNNKKNAEGIMDRVFY